jgi:cytochrome P450
MADVVPAIDLLEAVQDETFRANPYPTYRSMREVAGFGRAAMGWAITSYAHASRALRDPRLSSSERDHSAIYRQLREDNGGAALTPFDDAPFLIFMDPPDHTRLRALVQQAFTPRMVSRIRPRAEELTEQLLDAAFARGSNDAASSRNRSTTIDVVDDLAYPLPMTIICELLGVPTTDRGDFSKWSGDLTRAIDPQPLRTPEVEAAMTEAGMHLFGYVHELIEARRTSPGDDLLSAMIAAEEEGERLSAIELLTTVLLLLIAGHETTMNLIGSGMLALVQRPDELARLRDDPSRGRRAVDELLRFDPPVQFTQRVAAEPVEFDGITVDAGEHIAVLLAAANHDPEMFEDPERLDIGRTNAQHHLSFGGGIHHCLGAVLARTEGEIAINALLRRGTTFELAGEPRRRTSFTLRGLTSLPLRVT